MGCAVQALIDEFNIEAEDESPKQVAQLLVQLHNEARSCGWETANALIEQARAKGAQSWVEVPPPPKAAVDSDSDDEGEEGEADGDAPMDCGGEPRAPKQPQERIVDDDGFETVTKGSRGRRP